jgi:hypothetical protein
MSDRPEIEIQQQTAFGDDGQLESQRRASKPHSRTSALVSIIATVIHVAIGPRQASSASTIAPK